MWDACKLLWSPFLGLFRSRASLEAENLRQQIIVLQRTAPKRLCFNTINQVIFVGLAGSSATRSCPITRKDTEMANAQPSYRAYTVIKRKGQDDFWLPIGAAFDGHNIVLQALPIDGRVVLRVPKDDDAQRSDQRADNSNRAGARRR